MTLMSSLDQPSYKTSTQNSNGNPKRTQIGCFYRPQRCLSDADSQSVVCCKSGMARPRFVVQPPASLFRGNWNRHGDCLDNRPNHRSFCASPRGEQTSEAIKGHTG